MADRREQLIKAGEWLRHQRERQHLTVRELATQLDVTTQMVYDWQNGKNSVSDDRADQIAELFGLDIITVRRGLGLWVPDSDEQLAQPVDRGAIAELRRTIAEMDAYLEQLEHQDEDREQGTG